jgi:uncharacterized protein (TIGR03437 family)
MEQLIVVHTGPAIATAKGTWRETWNAARIPIPAVCFLLLAGGRIADAQCYTFSTSNATLAVNITQLPPPMVSAGGIYQYTTNSGLVANVSLTVGGTTYVPSPSGPVDMDVTVSSDSSLNFSQFSINVSFTTSNNVTVGALPSLAWNGTYFQGGALPPALPSLSTASTPTMIVGVQFVDNTYQLTTIGSCAPSTGPPLQPQLQTLETYTGPDPVGCNDTPQPSTSFSPSDATVNVFFVVDGMNPTGGDAVALHWINPSNSWVQTTNWNSTANTGASSRCFVEDLNIAQNIAPDWGPWQVQVYVNASALGTPYSFQVTGIPAPAITPGGIVPIGGTVPKIQPGEWVSIYGANLASSTVSWNGDFPMSLGGTSVTVNGKSAYLSFVSPGQINLQAPNDSAAGVVLVGVTTGSGSTVSTVTLAPFAPSFLLLDAKHVAGIIVRADGSGAYGGGTYDIIGPTGTSLGYPTVAARAGDTIELFGTGFGPTNPAVPAGEAFSEAAPTTNPVTLQINGVSTAPAFAGLSGAGLYQLTLKVPTGLGAGDVSLVATVGGAQTPSTVVISLQ